ncbi:MAG: ABC transporter ATP-binding protein [Spirochaetaceae bacterium]|nr:ABC transporter ATP-binding protein [Spirochaetaceae bacterium]
MLKIENMSCGYGRIEVIRNISIEVGDESVGLFGPNGAGKTTLINALMGIVKPTSGRISFNGRNITGIETHEAARMGIALVPQERELFPRMTVLDNLELGCLYIPGKAEGMADRLDAVFEKFPILKERRSQPAGTMSGGQQRQLAIGRALMADPKLLILDEPSLGLQPSIVSELYGRLAEMKKDISILVTEQNVRESLRAVDRGYVMENGGVAISGSAEELKTNPHVVKVYLGLS